MRYYAITKATGKKITGYLVQCEGVINNGHAYICPEVMSVMAAGGRMTCTIGPFYEVIPDTIRPVLDDMAREMIVTENVPAENAEENSEALNTRFEFLYRDASNYKTWNSFVLAGTISDEDRKLIASCCDGDNFIAEQVGLSHTFPGDGTVTDDDHAWCELLSDQSDCGFTKTTDEPTIEMTIEELVAAFAAAKGNWDELRYDPTMQ